MIPKGPLKTDELAGKKHSKKSFKTNGEPVARSLSVDNTGNSQNIPVSVADIRGVIRQLDSNIRSLNSMPEMESNSGRPTRPTTPYTGRPGRRSHTSKISPSGSDYDRSNVQASNTLDIWIRTKPFFRNTPADEQLSNLFAVPSIPAYTNVENSQHWIEIIGKYVDETRKIGDSCKIEKIPKKIDLNQEIAVYWKGKTPTFNIEKSIKKNKTTTHCLLSSLVPEQSNESHENQPKGRKSLTKVPVIDGASGYASISFEDRLKCELQYIGMLDEDEEFANQDNTRPFSTDLDLLSTHINKMRPVVEEFSRNVSAILPSIRIEEDKRTRIEHEYQSLITIARKLHKKS